MAKILLAASPRPREIMERVLDGHELACAETMAAAEEFLRTQNFDLIICTLSFDDSRMFDFLRLAKSRTDWRRIPFICARARANLMRTPIAIEAVEFTSRALGAVAFVDIARHQTDSQRRMRTEIEQILNGKAVKPGK